GKDHSEAINSIVKDANELKVKSLEDIIISRFKPFYGWTQEELINEFNINVNKANNQKNLNNMIVRAILHLPATAEEVNSEELEKADIKLKTITLKEGKPKEHFKFNGIGSFIDLVKENWEESSVYNYLEKTKFLL